ncbi:nucleotide exchange factor GrpE [Streptomyces bobili]|uniref:nucleotide exchange factor GrpE n=1 Tax=Streptomyces bobili TaxID=67280 RepID=UPI002253CA16|nr:nucleotide exchange factor GrpE [Streptomyces bobili]MCX5521690.1 nucleotide exchange factor GrpE [Streptomyces bobili]
MNGPTGPDRAGERALTVVPERPRNAVGLEPRRRADLEPAPRSGPARGDTDVSRALLREQAAALRRVKDEYDSYRRRVHRERRSMGGVAVANVLTGLLPVLDAIDEARRQHDVVGGFEQVVNLLEGQLTALGLESFGAPGDPFDPARHEAVSFRCTDQVERPTCSVVLRPGYRVGEHLLRPAEVEVTGPPPRP